LEFKDELQKNLKKGYRRKLKTDQVFFREEIFRKKETLFDRLACLSQIRSIGSTDDEMFPDRFFLFFGRINIRLCFACIWTQGWISFLNSTGTQHKNQREKDPGQTKFHKILQAKRLQIPIINSPDESRKKMASSTKFFLF
jgi:hypothetical protein